MLAHPFLDPTARLAKTQQAQQQQQQQLAAQQAPSQAPVQANVSAMQVQALLPVLQQLAALNVPIDGSTGGQISEEIARQLAENGTVDITGIVNEFRGTAPEAPIEQAVVAPAVVKEAPVPNQAASAAPERPKLSALLSDEIKSAAGRPQKRAEAPVVVVDDKENELEEVSFKAKSGKAGTKKKVRKFGDEISTTSSSGGNGMMSTQSGFYFRNTVHIW